MKLRWGSEQGLEDALAMYLRQRERLDLQAMGAFAKRNRAECALRELEEPAKDLSPR